jgi:hypothetical protein
MEEIRCVSGTHKLLATMRGVSKHKSSESGRFVVRTYYVQRREGTVSTI